MVVRISRSCRIVRCAIWQSFLLHLLATVARLAGPGGVRAVVAESVLVKQQLLILNRSRKRSPSLRHADRVVAGVCTLLMRPTRLVRVAIVLNSSTLLRFQPGPKGPSREDKFSPHGERRFAAEGRGSDA